MLLAATEAHDENSNGWKVRMCLDLLCILWIRELYFKVVTRKTDSQCVEIELQDVKKFFD